MRVAAWGFAVLFGTVLPLSALEVDGVYKLTPTSDCITEEAVLRIQDRIFHGSEGQCRMENPVNVRDMDAQLFDMACSGEGSKWVERALFMRGAEGELILLWNGYAFRYERCPEPEKAAEAD